jgi:hypothetical protein
MGPIMQSGLVDVLGFIGGTKGADALIAAHPAPHRLKVRGVPAPLPRHFPHALPRPHRHKVRCAPSCAKHISIVLSPAPPRFKPLTLRIGLSLHNLEARTSE